jgi:undecaprenyl-diphosphatase
MMAAVTYLTLAVSAVRLQVRRLVKVYLIAATAFPSLAVGASRVYLGVHWPTDVFAGWFAGAAWALLCWIAACWLQIRGSMEAEPPEVGARPPEAQPRGAFRQERVEIERFDDRD